MAGGKGCVELNENEVGSVLPNLQTTADASNLILYEHGLFSDVKSCLIFKE